METGNLRPSGGAHPLPDTTFGMEFVDDEAQLTLAKSYESPPPRLHSYRKLIGEICYKAPSHEKQFFDPQDGCPELVTTSSDDEPVFMGRTSTTTLLSDPEQQNLPQATSKYQTRLRTRMESFILPPPIFPENDGKDAPLDPKQPELDQNMENDRDKTIEPLQRMVICTPFPMTHMDHLEGQYTPRPFGLPASPHDLATMEARFKEYDQAAAIERFNEFLRHYNVHSETTKPGDPIEDDDGTM